MPTKELLWSRAELSFSGRRVAIVKLWTTVKHQVSGVIVTTTPLKAGVRLAGSESRETKTLASG